MRRLSFFAVAAGLAGTTACGGSRYDAAWVEGDLARTAGHAVPTQATPTKSKPFVPTLPKDVHDVTAVTEDDAVSIALWNSAQFRADLAQLGTTRADLADAAVLPNPNFSFLFPVSTRQLELSVQYPVSQLLQRPWRIAAAKLDVERMARSLVQNGLDLVRDARVAWAEVVAAKRRRALRERARELVAKSADLARSRLASGDASRLESDLVHAEELAAADLATRGAREETIAHARLRLVLGLAESPLGEKLGTADSKSVVPEPDAVAGLEKVALASRPDLRAAELAVEAAGKRIGLERSRIVQLFARLDAKPVGPAGGSPLLWLPGFGGDVPIFNQNPGGRGRANAELERTAWLYLSTRQQIVTEVRTTFEELRMALASRRPWGDEIVPLQERNLATATSAYGAGGEAYLVVIEATRRLVDARTRELELELEVHRARARLDRAVGWRIHASK